MRRHLTSLLTALAALLALPPSIRSASAAPSDAPLAAVAGPSLGLEDAVGRALARHPALAAAAQARTGAEARIRQARSTWLPRATVEAGYRYAGPVPEIVVETGLTLPGQTEPLVIRQEAGSEHSAQVGARVGWRAWDWGARDAGVDAARAGAEAAAAERGERAADVAWGVRAAYLAVLVFDEVAAVTARSLETAREIQADAELQRSAGLGTDLDVAGAASRVADLEARLVDARQSRERATEDLRSLLGLAEGAPLTLSDALPDVVAAPGSPGDAAPQAAVADDEGERVPHPRETRLAALQQATEQQRASVERSFWPTVDLYGSTHYQYPRTFIETDTAGLVWAAGIALTWEVFDGGLRTAREDELEAKAAELASLREAAREEFDRAAIGARTQLASARAAAIAATRSREAAEVYLDAARTSLAAGTGRALDVRRAEEAVDRASLATAKARFDAAMANAALLRAKGIALAEDPR